MKDQKPKLRIFQIYTRCAIDLRDDHVGAYATMSAFFLLLALIPCLLLLLTFLQYTPITESEFIVVIEEVFPSTIAPLIVTTIHEVFNASMAVIPLTVLVAIWSCGKGIMALSYGLNCIHDMIETRNYLFLRIRAAFYTIYILGSIVVILLAQVFGESLAAFIIPKAPFLEQTILKILSYRNWFTIPYMVFLILTIYKFLPNRKVRFWGELPGAVFSTIGWLVCSYIFSIYLEIFNGFSNMYGSFTTIVLIMMWMYFLMFILLIGAEVNLWCKEFGIIQRIPVIGELYARREEAYIEKVRKHHIDVMREHDEKIRKG